MAKIVAPLLSLQAKGNFARVLNFARKGDISYVRKSKPKIAPFDPKSPIQLFNRDYFGVVVDIWHNLTEPQKLDFVRRASGFSLSGFNLYVKEYRKQHPAELGNTRAGFSELGNLI